MSTYWSPAFKLDAEAKRAQAKMAQERALLEAVDCPHCGANLGERCFKLTEGNESCAPHGARWARFRMMKSFGAKRMSQESLFGRDR